MGLGTKNRQRQTADICKQHLREKYCDKLALVEEFVVEIEGARKDCDITRWAQFTDIKDIKQETLKRLELHFENWLNPGLRIIKQASREDFIGTSRLGGLPDVSPGFIWPIRDGRSLGFLAQINCSEVAPHHSEHAFPDSGLLHFFYDIQEQPWGYDPKHRGGAVVFYTSGGPLEAAPSPFDRDAEVILPSIPVGFRPFLSIPGYDSTACDSLNLEDADREAYLELYEAVSSEASSGQPNHQLLGHSNNLQGDMQLEYQLVFSGLCCDNSTDYNDSRRNSKLEQAIGDFFYSLTPTTTSISCGAIAAMSISGFGAQTCGSASSNTLGRFSNAANSCNA